METLTVVCLAAALAWLNRIDAPDVTSERDWDAWAADIASRGQRP